METARSLLAEGFRLWAKWFGEWWKPVVIVMLAAILLFFNAASNSRTQRRLEDVAAQTHSALCALAADQQQRLDDAQRFLENHPQGIEGISRADIQRSIEGHKDTVQALNVLHCNGGL